MPRAELVSGQPIQQHPSQGSENQSYILVHQAGLADTAISEDDDLDFHLVRGVFSSTKHSLLTPETPISRMIMYLEEDLLSRRHDGRLWYEGTTLVKGWSRGCR